MVTWPARACLARAQLKSTIILTYPWHASMLKIIHVLSSLFNSYRSENMSYCQCRIYYSTLYQYKFRNGCDPKVATAEQLLFLGYALKNAFKVETTIQSIKIR
jgi:hypothetical protein